MTDCHSACKHCNWLLDGKSCSWPAAQCARQHNVDSGVVIKVQMGIPFVLIGGEPFWERKEVKDVMAYLHLLANLHNEAALLKIINMPKRALGERTLEDIASWAR